MSNATHVKTHLTDDRVLVLGSNLTLSKLELLHECMLERSLHNGPVEIDGSNVEAIDTASIQLLSAFVNYAYSWINGLIWMSPSTALIEAAELLGLADFLGLNAPEQAA